MNFYMYFNKNKEKETTSYKIYEAIQKSIPKSYIIDNNKHYKDGICITWGFSCGINIVNEYINNNQDYYIIDLGYFNRSNYFRITKNKLNCNYLIDAPDDRLSVLHIKRKKLQTTGDTYLLCPSSGTVNSFYNEPKWENDARTILKNVNVRTRYKPRKNRKNILFEDDILSAKCIVTSVSHSAIEAFLYGKYIISNDLSPVAPISNRLSNYNNLVMPNEERVHKWLCTLSYHQFTLEEYSNGYFMECLNKFKI